MPETGRKDFCIRCRKETVYCLKKKTVRKIIRDKEYVFSITAAVCAQCGAEMSIPGLIDQNISEFDTQFRKAEGIISVSDIEKIMRIYHIGKAPLSLALGFGEITVTRYLEGQIPSREYSDIMKEALASPVYMKQKLLENRDKMTEAAYNKAMSAVSGIRRAFILSASCQRVVSGIFENLGEVSPLALQKLLYFIQGVSLALYNKPMFEEDCRAWLHGPVYPEVYEFLRDFQYDPAGDPRFALLEGKSDGLSGEEKKVIDLVIHTFGIYSGKTLENITHREIPWLQARTGIEAGIPSDEPMPKESIREYFLSVHRRYGINTEEGLLNYIRSVLEKNNETFPDQ